MRLFLDTAKLDEIRQANKWGVISGVTTNPTLMAQGAKGSGRPWQEAFKATVQEVCFIVRGSVSAEVTAWTPMAWWPRPRISPPGRPLPR